MTCAGTRAAELALRLKYAGVPAERSASSPSSPPPLTGPAGAPSRRRLYVLPTYTALLELRAELARRGHVGRF